MSTINKYIFFLFSTDVQTEYHSTLRMYTHLGETPCTIRVPTPPQPGLRGLTLSSLATLLFTVPHHPLGDWRIILTHFIKKVRLVVEKGNRGNYLKHCCIIKSTVQLYKKTRILEISIRAKVCNIVLQSV